MGGAAIFRSYLVYHYFWIHMKDIVAHESEMDKPEKHYLASSQYSHVPSLTTNTAQCLPTEWNSVYILV